MVRTVAWTYPPPGTPHPNYIWKNGEFADWEMLMVHVFNIGGMAASAIYEGIRGYWNPELKQLYINSLKEHVNRLFNSMKIMRLDIPFTKEEIENTIPELIRRNSYKENVYIRPNIFRYKPPFKELIPGTPTTWITLIVFPRPSGLMELHTRRVGVSSWIRPTDQMSPTRVKSIGNLLNGGLAELEMEVAGYEEAIQLTIDGKVAEMGAGANICLIKDGTVITPSNRQSILEGVTKDIVFRIAKQSLKINTCERAVDRTELYIADEVFICGTGHAEITPVISVDGISVGDGKPGKITKNIRKTYYDIVLGKRSEYMDLLTPVY